jgi:hypothetical protein
MVPLWVASETDERLIEQRYNQDDIEVWLETC